MRHVVSLTDGSRYYHWILVIKMRPLRIGIVAAGVWLAVMTIAAGISSAQTTPSTVDGYIAAAKVAAGMVGEVEVENRYVQRSGQVVWMRVSVGTILDAEGRYEGAVAG